MTNDQVGKSLDFLTEAYKNGNTPKATLGPMVGFCKGVGISVESVRDQLSLIPPPILAKLIKGYATGLSDSPMKAKTLEAAEMLSSEKGQAWFGEFVGRLSGTWKDEKGSAKDEKPAAEAPSA